MTRNGNFKRRVRARAAKTGESYTSALSHIREPRPEPQSGEPAGKSLRLAVAQTTVCLDPRDADAFRANGAEMRRLMREARDAGARLIHFCEGTICFPNKRILSETGPAEIGAADWSRYRWDVLREELDAIRSCARELNIWTVFGAPHRLTPPHRPHNSLYILSDRGELVTRYDERLLSHTKFSFLYSPGRIPVTFEVEGMRFGCAAGMESHYHEIFTEYERLDVDCVLFSTSGEVPSAAPPFAAEVLGLAASNTFWVSYATHAPQSVVTPCGIAGPRGQWAARCPNDGSPGIAIAEIETDPANLARPWRRTARGDLYRPHQIDGDPRSDSREAF
jgi:predicted amidohydrolase